jgi:hypothetical protein
LNVDEDNHLTDYRMTLNRKKRIIYVLVFVIIL